MVYLFNKDHPSLTSASDIKELCRPLQKYFQTTHFSYVRLYRDNSRIQLSTDAEWTQFFYKKYMVYEKNDGLTETHCQNLSGHITWNNLRDKLLMVDAKNHLNVEQGIVIIKQFKHFSEFAFFASPLSCSTQINITENYSNNIDLLNQFILTLKHQCNGLLKELDKQKIIFSKQPKNPSLINPAFSNNTELLRIRKNFLKEIYSNTSLQVSSREMECIFHTKKFKTAKEIGRTMNLSYKTVENHLASAKLKLGCNHKHELFEKLFGGIYGRHNA